MPAAPSRRISIRVRNLFRLSRMKYLLNETDFPKQKNAATVEHLLRGSGILKLSDVERRLEGPTRSADRR